MRYFPYMISIIFKLRDLICTRASSSFSNTHMQSILDEPTKYHSQSIKQIIQRYILTIISNKDTRNVFMFLILNITFTLVEFLYGYYNNSLGLISDAVHMLFVQFF